jgi:hypothetical protein
MFPFFVCSVVLSRSKRSGGSISHRRNPVKCLDFTVSEVILNMTGNGV